MSADRQVLSRRTVLLALALVGASSISLAGTASAAGPSHTAQPPPSPAVTGPVRNTSPVGDPAHGYPFLATDVDLAAAGYVEQEFFVSGAATRYATQGVETATVTSTGHQYRTRIVVRRPVSARAFNGVVVAEWNNVSNQWDQEVDWFQSHEHLIREGYAWVGISAQRAGLHSPTGLKAWSPSRYGTLDVTAGGAITDDTLSYDIFSQAVRAVRRPAGTDPLGALPPPRFVIATGHSQSAGRLANYYNGVQPLSGVLDAVVLHGGGGVLRTDLTAPVFRLNSEGDVATGILPAAARAQPDSPVLRSWEVAGASHGDWKLITDYGPLRKRDIGSYPGGFPGEPQTCTLPSLSRVPQHMAQNAVYDHTVAWVARGKQPPTAPKIRLTDTVPPAVARDDLGLALGGLRLAQHEVPLRVNSGVNSGPGFCFLDGSSVPLTEAQLAVLHPTVKSYVARATAVTTANLRAGYLPRSFVRDPAWYSEIRELIDGYAAQGRIAPRTAAVLTTYLRRAEQAGSRGNEVGAIYHLTRLRAVADSRLAADPAARDGIRRVSSTLTTLLARACC
jgi:hypothetical protein